MAEIPGLFYYVIVVSDLRWVRKIEQQGKFNQKRPKKYFSKIFIKLLQCSLVQWVLSLFPLAKFHVLTAIVLSEYIFVFLTMRSVKRSGTASGGSVTFDFPNIV